MKMNATKEIDEYIHSVPKEVGELLQTIRKIVKEELPDAIEVISYKMPAFRWNDSNILYYSAWKNHVSIYPFTSQMEKDIKEASDYKMSGKGTIQFPLDKPLPITLIRKIVQHMKKDNLARKGKSEYK